METSQVKRTVKKKFLIANKCGKGIKEGTPYVIVFGTLVLKSLVDSKDK